MSGTVILNEDGSVYSVLRGEFIATGYLTIPPDRFPQTPYVGDRVNLHFCPWDPMTNATAQRMVSLMSGLADLANVLPPGHTIDPRNYGITRDLTAETLTITYTVNAVTYYVGHLSGPTHWGWGFLATQGSNTNIWYFRGYILTVPAAAYTRTDWTNGIVAAIDASPDFPVEVLGREASHFQKAQIDFHTTRDTLAFDEDLPNQTPKQQAAVRRLRDGTMLTCRQVELESRRTAFARAVEVCLDRARTITDTYSVEEDALALGQYVEHALAAIGDGEATETTLATLRARLDADLASRDPVTYSSAEGAEVGALVNGAPYARLVTQVHLLLTGLTPVLDPVDLYAPEAKRVPAAQVPDTGAKLAVQGTIPDTGSPPAVAIRLTRHGGTRALQRRFDDETTWSAWADPTDADLRASGRNQTVWFRYAPKMSNDDV